MKLNINFYRFIAVVLYFASVGFLLDPLLASGGEELEDYNSWLKYTHPSKKIDDHHKLDMTESRDNTQHSTLNTQQKIILLMDIRKGF